MSAVQDVLPNIRGLIVRNRDEGLNEANTKAALIDPVLRALGWNVEEPEQVDREYRYRSSDNPVDYALMDLRTPCIFVEAKALGKNLDDPKSAGQIMGYASVAGVDWVVLTDGNEYRIYNAHARVPVEQKLFRTLHITGENDSRVIETLNLLALDGLKEKRLEAHWQAQFVDRQVATVLEGLFSPEPDKRFVSWLVRRTTDLKQRDVTDSLGRVRARFEFPVVHGSESDGPSELPLKGRSRRQVRRKRGEQRQSRQRVKLVHLVEARIVTPPLDLQDTYKRRPITARIEADGAITVRGESFWSPSGAADAARRLVNGTPDVRVPTDGWTNWKFTDADGQVRPIDVLRERYLAQGETDAS